LNPSKPCSNGADQGWDRLMDGWMAYCRKGKFICFEVTNREKKMKKVFCLV
jgi:hypothetical protein